MADEAQSSGALLLSGVVLLAVLLGGCVVREELAIRWLHESDSGCRYGKAQAYTE